MLMCQLYFHYCWIRWSDTVWKSYAIHFNIKANLKYISKSNLIVVIIHYYSFNNGLLNVSVSARLNICRFNSRTRQKVKRRSIVPLDRSVLVLQAVHYGSPVALHGIVVRPDNLLKRGHGDVPRHRRAADGDGDITWKALTDNVTHNVHAKNCQVTIRIQWERIRK